MEHMTIIRGRFSGRQIAIAYARPIKLDLGAFAGRGVIRQRMTALAVAGAAMAIASYAAMIWAAPTCRIVVSDRAGESYVIGSGDTLAEAWQNHGPVPSGWRELRMPGCVR